MRSKRRWKVTRTDHALEFLMRESYNPHRMVWTRVVDVFAVEEGLTTLREVINLMIGLTQCLVNEWVEFEFQDDNNLWVRLTYKGHVEALRRRNER